MHLKQTWIMWSCDISKTRTHASNLSRKSGWGAWVVLLKVATLIAKGQRMTAEIYLVGSIKNGLIWTISSSMGALLFWQGNLPAEEDCKCSTWLIHDQKQAGVHVLPPERGGRDGNSSEARQQPPGPAQ